MMMMDPDKAVTAIIRKRNGDKEPRKNPLTKPTDGELDPRSMAAEDVMAAIHSKDHQHLMEALSNFHDMHMMHREREEQEGPRDEEKFDMESQRAES